MLQKSNTKLNFAEIFNNSQHVTSSDLALTQLKKLYKSTEFCQFEGPFRNYVKKLFQSKQTIYFKTSCEFLCKFLQHVSKLSDHPSTPKQPVKSPAKTNRKGDTRPKRGVKRKSLDVSDDELVLDLEKENITDHDRIVSTCLDVADHYMQVLDEECRLNAVFFICKFLSYVESLDEEICTALKLTLPKRVRDRRPMIRAQAVLASRIFQDNPMTQEAFMHHFYRDPELVVRKALLQIMDTAIFGYNFLVDATQDAHEVMRKSTFQRLGKISPLSLTSGQLHRVIHNGLNERERQASYSFKTHTLEPWLAALYDGTDLYKLLESFDVLSYHDDVCRLLELIYGRDLDKLENNGATTKLHQVVESFRERWLSNDNNCLPTISQIDERVTVIWFTLVKFCKSNQTVIKPVKVRTIQPQEVDPNESIERILDSQQRDDDEVAELYERLTPDLVNLVGFLRRFVQHSSQVIKSSEAAATKLEYIFHQIMQFVSNYEVGDELERKTVQEVFDFILKENLLAGSFTEFITPIIKALFALIYSSSSNLMMNYISEMINNVRSHLEDLAALPQPKPSAIAQSKILAPGMTPKSTKKVRINSKPKRNSYAADLDPQNIEYKIATIRVELEELKDKLDDCIKEKDFDQAKTINNKIANLDSELNILHDRRCSIASDVSHMSMVVETEPGDGKLSSTMIGDASMIENQSQHGRDVKIFRHNTNELLKCLHMYFGCLQSVKILEVPATMLNHLAHLSYECLDDFFRENTRVRSSMMACNGLTALIDKNVALGSSTMTLLAAACLDPVSIEVRTIGFKCLVDVWCQHNGLEIDTDKVEKFLSSSLRDYGKYDPKSIKKHELEFITAVIEGTTKLFYFRRIDSPKYLSHLILWWYHPRTHSKLKQFIGIFLPAFVNDTSKQQSADDTWLKDLLEGTFITSIEYLHNYILGPGYNLMAASDMHSLINFLCNLIPISFHARIIERVDDRIKDLTGINADLLKYLKQSKNSLSSAVTAANSVQTPLARPLQFN